MFLVRNNLYVKALPKRMYNNAVQLLFREKSIKYSVP